MPRIKQFKEEDVLRKAMEVFWEKGYNATSISDLVMKLGINRASLYDTFGGKRLLFEKALQLYKVTNRADFISFLDSQPSVKEGLLKLFTMMIEAGVQATDPKGCLVVNTATEWIPCDKSIRLHIDENRKDYESLFYSYLKKGVAKGEISPDKDLHTLASYLFMMQNGLQVIAKIHSDEAYLMNIVKAGLEVLDT